MSKVNLNNLANLQNEASAVGIINANNDAVEAFSQSVLSTDGTTPNQMNAELDMNSNRIINLSAPVTDTEPVRLQDINAIVESGPGNLISTANPAGGEAAVFSGSTGRIVTNYNSTGIVKATAGVLSSATAGTDYYKLGAQVIPITDGGTGQATAVNAFNAIKQTGTSSTTGALQLATTTEANTGTNTSKAVTPAGVDAYYAGHINTSLAPYSFNVRPQVGLSTNYTLALTDSGKMLIGNNSAANITVTVPLNATVPFAIGTQIDFLSNYSFKLTFAGATGAVSILSKNSFKSLFGQYSAATLVYAGGNFWWLFGDLAP